MDMPKNILEPEKRIKRIVRTYCDRCHCGCGVLVYVENGKAVKVEGDPDCPVNEGALCPKGLAILQFAYHPDRIKQPLKRTGRRGAGQWQPISWDEGLEEVAARFKEILERYGPTAITWSWGDAALHCHYLTKQGWLYAMNAPNHFHSDAHYCFHPVMIANKVTFGDFITSETGPDYQNARCIMLWGGNPAMSHPVAARNIMTGRRRGAKLIVVDPRFTEMAAKADLFLQPRPATDDALALGILNIVIREELYDKEFVTKWCVGFDELKKRVQEYPPQRVAEITWIEKEEIIRAAFMYATNRPGTVHTRMGTLMNTNSIQTVRAICMLPAIFGDLDVQGGNLLGNKPLGFKSRHEIISQDLKQSPEIEDQRIGAQDFPLLCSSKSLAHNNSHPPSVIHAMVTGKPYPIEALWVCNNLLLALEDAKETKRALLNLEFLVGSDFFMTPTMELCDIILPPCSYLARDEVAQGYHATNFFGVRQKVIEPEFDTRDEREITYEITKRMGLKFPAEWDTIEKQNEMRVRGMGMTFAELKSKGYFLGPIQYKKYEVKGFNTPSGKVELYSSILEKFGYDPLPYYQENPETPISAPEIARDYPLILITGGRHVVYYHGSNKQIPWLREIVPYPALQIHPQTASALDIRSEDWVWIEAPRNRGRVKMKVELTEAVHPHVVHAPSHWWYPEVKDTEHGCWEANINAILTNDPPYDPICGATPLRGCQCRVYKVEEPENG